MKVDLFFPFKFSIGHVRQFLRGVFTSVLHKKFPMYEIEIIHI